MGPARVMRSRTWRRFHTYSSIRDAHRAAACVPSLGTGFQPRGEGHGAGRGDTGDRREGAPPDAALRQRCRPRALSHHYRRERLEVRCLLRLPYRGFVPVAPATVGLNEDQTLEAPSPAVVSLTTPTPAWSGGKDRERRPTCSSGDQEAGLHGTAIRRPSPGRRESHYADPGLVRRERPRAPFHMCRAVTRKRGCMAWRSVQVAVAGRCRRRPVRGCRQRRCTTMG